MANQYVNKVQKSDGTTIIDITDTTATAEDVAQGKYFYDSSGARTVGTSTVPSGTKNISITQNGTTTEDVTSYATASITTAVPASAVDSGTKSISTNGTHDVVGYASANVAVQNSYSAGDEGKVVSSGALVSQTAHADVTPTTSDQTIDTTTNNSVKVKGDADLVAGNIKKDVEIFGVTGSFEGSGGGGISVDDIATDTEPSGAITLGSSVTTIKQYAFAGKPVTSITGSQVTQIDGFAFANSSIQEITSDNFPNLTTLSISSLESISNLKRVYLTGAKEYIKNFYVFRNNQKLKVVRIPFATGNTTQQVFANNYVQEVLDIGPVNGIAANFASQARTLSVLILRKTSVCTLSNVSAFANTALRGYNGGSGTVYIPKVLYDHLGDGSSSDYIAATNWSTIYNEGHLSFAKLEGSPYEQTNWDDSSFLT